MPCNAMVSLIFGVTTSLATFPERPAKYFFLFFRSEFSFKTISGESASVTTKITAPWNEESPPKLLSNYKMEKITQMSLACSTSVYHLKLTICLEKSALEAITIFYDWHVGRQLVQLKKSWKFLWIASPKTHHAFKL